MSPAPQRGKVILRIDAIRLFKDVAAAQRHP
jgi:hypothetical protein